MGTLICRYTANIGVVLLNKLLLSFYGFKYPVLLTLMHMVACSILTIGTVTIRAVKFERLQNMKQLGNVCLLSVVFMATIILGNVSLRFIPVSFNQVIGACTPVFTAILSFLVQGNQESPWTYAALVPVVVGIMVAAGFEPSFHMLGFTVCMAATGLRAFKSVLQVRSPNAWLVDAFEFCSASRPRAVKWWQGHLRRIQQKVHHGKCSFVSFTEFADFCRQCFYRNQRKS